MCPSRFAPTPDLSLPAIALSSVVCVEEISKLVKTKNSQGGHLIADSKFVTQSHAPWIEGGKLGAVPTFPAPDGPIKAVISPGFNTPLILLRRMRVPAFLVSTEYVRLLYAMVNLQSKFIIVRFCTACSSFKCPQIIN
jgi:hypothetical protein